MTGQWDYAGCVAENWVCDPVWLRGADWVDGVGSVCFAFGEVRGYYCICL